jgi:hypothetical protein
VPFIAICPHCRNSRFRVPSRKRGSTMPCPRCQHDFTLIPPDEADEADEADFDTDAVATASSATGAIGASDASGVIAVPDDDSSWLRLVPFATVGVAYLLSPLPLGRVVGIVLALAGGAFAWLGLLDRDRKSVSAYFGLGLNLLMAVVLAAFPGQLGLSGWWSNPKPEDALVIDGWVDAGEAGWEENGVQVALTFASIGPDPAAAASGVPAGRFLWIGVIVTNAGAKEVAFTPWDAGAANGPILTALDGTRIVGQPHGDSTAVTIAPEKSAECLLRFDLPPPEQDLLLELSAEAYGGTTPVRFRIPHALILSR